MHKINKQVIEQKQKELINNSIESNKYINLLYSKPQRISYKKSIFGYFSYIFTKHKYRRKTILPVYNELLTTSPSFETMCNYANFIRLLEKVFFYNNALLKDNDEKYDKLVSDSELNNNKKNLILDLGKDNVLITFTMENNYGDEVIDIKVRYNFGKKSTMNYVVVNRDIVYDSIHSENLMITILERLQKSMAKLFLDYYDKI